MGGLDHRAIPTPDAQPERVSAQRIRYGHALFVLYLLLYGAFVLLNAFAPSVMARTPAAGINLAVLSGLGLIGAAFLLALVYDWLSRFLDSRGQNEGRHGT
ncbi:MAG: DUF485 domain-containing protein [Pirellulales bacterium]